MHTPPPDRNLSGNPYADLELVYAEETHRGRLSSAFVTQRKNTGGTADDGTDLTGVGGSGLRDRPGV